MQGMPGQSAMHQMQQRMAAGAQNPQAGMFGGQHMMAGMNPMGAMQPHPGMQQQQQQQGPRRY